MANPEDYGLSNEAASDIDRAIEIIQEFSDLGQALQLVGWVLEQSAEVPHDGKFANATAAMAAFTRAYHDILAALNLCQVHCYPQALALLRSVYEAAGIGRTMAKSPKVADAWMRGEWQPDMKSRQFVRNVMYAEAEPEEQDEAVEAYSRSYELLSEWAHITVRSALAPYVEDSEDGYKLALEPVFDEELLRFTLTGIVKESVFLAFAIRNSVARLEVLGPQWLEDLDELAERVAGPYAQKLDIDYEEFDRRHKILLSNLRSSSEHKRHMRRSPQSVDNLLRSDDPES